MWANWPDRHNVEIGDFKVACRLLQITSIWPKTIPWVQCWPSLVVNVWCKARLAWWWGPRVSVSLNCRISCYQETWPTLIIGSGVNLSWRRFIRLLVEMRSKNAMNDTYKIDRDLHLPMRPRFRRMLRDLMDSRELAGQLFLRNLRAQYRQTFLGYIWLVVPTVATTLLWLFLRAQNVATYQGETSYALFLLIGLLWWQLFADSIQSPIRIVSASQAMLLQVNFPKESLILAGVFEALFGFLVRLLVTVVLIVGVGWLLNPLLWQAFLSGISIVLMGTAIGVLLVPMGMLYKDIDRSLTLILQFWMYMTPIVYELPTGRTGEWLVLLNPIAAPLMAARDGVLGAPTEHWLMISMWFLLFVMISYLGWVIYRVSMPIIIERMTG